MLPRLAIILAGALVLPEGVEQPSVGNFGFIEGGETLFGGNYGPDEASSFLFNAPLTSTTDDLGYGGATATYSDIGPFHIWKNGQLVEVADNVAAVGGEIPPGMTGAGAGGGYINFPTFVNRITYSDDLSTGWTANGTGTVSCGQSNTPYADSTTTCKITDDDASAEENIEFTYNWTTPSAGITYIIFAGADSAQTLDVEIEEATNCAGSTTGQTAVSIGTDWKGFSFFHTLQDSSCDDFTLRIYPHDASDGVGGTGHAYVTMVQAFRALNYESVAFYRRTEGSEVSFGDTDLAYNGPSNEDTASYTYSFKYTPLMSNNNIGLTYPLNVESATDWKLRYDAGEALRMYVGAVNNITGAGQSFAPGTEQLIVGQWDTVSADYYELSRDGSSLGTDATDRTNPATFVEMEIGSNGGGSQQIGFFQNFTVIKE